VGGNTKIFLCSEELIRTDLQLLLLGCYNNRWQKPHSNLISISGTGYSTRGRHRKRSIAIEEVGASEKGMKKLSNGTV
jgi:hypothetical protein